MTAVTLRRSDPSRNLHRYYRMDIQPDLFGAWYITREWGRLGQVGGQSCSVPYFTSAEAHAAFTKLRHAKERKGYA